MTHSVWIPLLVLCTAFNGSVPRHVHQDHVSIKKNGHKSVEDILKDFPITLPEGIDPKNINATFITLNTCIGLKEELASVNKQLQEKTLRNSQLDEEAFALRRDVRLLKVQLSTCSSTASAITDSYQIQLQNQMKELLELFDSDSFLILQILSLNREVAVLEDKLRHGTNYSQSEKTQLEDELTGRVKDLNGKVLLFKERHGNSEQILQIISTQNAIWKLEQEESRAGEAGLQQSRNMTVLQMRLSGLIFELQGRDNSSSALLDLISVHSKISMIQKLINVHIKKSKRINDDYQRQLRQMSELLTSKIRLLNRDERNTELTNEILALQRQLMDLRELSNAARTETEIKALRVSLEVEKKRLEHIQKKLEEEDYTQTQMLIKIINMMKELRELQALQKDGTRKKSTSQSSTLQTLLETKERDFFKAQERIKELERELQQKSKESAGLEEKYTQAKSEFEQRIAELHTNGDAKEALALSVINLNNELRNLRELMSMADTPQKKEELQMKLKGKEEELRSLTAELKKYLSNPDLILTIIQLQNEIADLQKNSDGDAGQRLKEMLSRVDGLLGEIENEEKLKHILKIMLLQNQVEHLQRQLSLQHNITAAQLTELEKELSSKQAQLQTTVTELKETDETNARLIMELSDLNNKMRKLQEEKQSQGETGLVTINKLRQELQAREEQHRRDQDEIVALQKRLEQTETECANHQQKIKDLEKDLDLKMGELISGTDHITALIVQLSTLNLQQGELQTQLQTTESKSKITELKKRLEENVKEIKRITDELKAKSPQPQKFLQILAIQTMINTISNTAVNESDYNRIIALQDHLNMLIEEMEGENSDVTKQTLKIFTAQQEVARLQKQKEREAKALLEKIKGLENELEETRNQIREKTLILESSDSRITNLSMEIMELHQKIKPLEDDISILKETHEENLREVQKRLDLTQAQLEDSENQLKKADAKTFNLLMEVSDLRTQLKKTQREASRAAGKNIKELEQKLETQERENKKMEIANKELILEVRELKKCCSDNSAHCGDLQRQLQQSHNDAELMEKQLQDQASKLREVEQELEKEKKNATKNFEQNLQELEHQIQQHVTFAETLQQQLQQRDSLLSQMGERMDKCTNEQKTLDKNYSELQAEKKRLEKLVEDLQTKLSVVDSQTVHARQIRFDPNTAHPRVTLSRDFTEINTVDQPQNVPDHPDRFDVILAVLGKTDFSSGRNYWEVSISDKNCFHFGMASASAPRRGTSVFSPSKGFWTIVLTKNGLYRALDVIPVSLDIPVKPLIMGVMIDYSKGQVSFYNAGARSHIYTFQGQPFTEKMFPFINFCVEPSLQPSPIISVTPGSVDWLRSV